MKLGFVYAGQGSQHVGMGRDFYDCFSEFAETMDHATEYIRDVTEFDVKDLCFNGPVEKLSQTRYTQPCMVSFAVGVTKLLKKAGITPEYVCGLSLGEYSALYAADVLDEGELINLTAYRGKVMEEAVTGREVKMAAVLMMDRDVIRECCEKASERVSTTEKYVVEIANYNCKGQIVISGDACAVDEAIALLKEAGARKIVPLAVSGPFHTSLMKPAGDKLRERFKAVKFKNSTACIIHNVTGRPMEKGESLPMLLEKQVQSSVLMEDSIRYMAEEGVDTIVEIGPGNTISRFVKKTAPDITVMSIDTVDDYKKVVETLGGKYVK